MPPLIVLSIKFYKDNSCSTMVCPHCGRFNPIEFTQPTSCIVCGKSLPKTIDVHDDIMFRLSWHKTA